MIQISETPDHVSYVVQMYSQATGTWVDTTAGAIRGPKHVALPLARQSLGNYHAVHPGRAFRLVERMVTDRPMGDDHGMG